MIAVLGVHPSVEAVFPPDRFLGALGDTDVGVRVVTTPAEYAGCDGLVTFGYEDAFLDAGFEWIHSIQSGVDRFPFEALRDQGVALTNSAGIHGDSVGETVAGYMLMFSRRLHLHRDNQHTRGWDYPGDTAFTLPGKTLCVIGLGTLGRGIAARAAGLGLTVLGVKQTPVPVDHVTRVYPTNRLMDAISEARFVAVAVPLTAETEGLIGHEELAGMREDAYLLNVSRGGVVDEDALLEALQAGAIVGAGIDVFETEPLPDDAAFWNLENVIITPHCAGANHDYANRVAAIVRENLRRIAADRPLTNQVL